MIDKIVVTLSTFAEYGEEPLSYLRESGIEFVVSSLGRRIMVDEIVPMCADATGLIAGVEPYRQETLAQLPYLKCISRAGVGTDNIDLGWAQQQGIEVKITDNVVIQPVVELTVGLIISLTRKLIEHSRLLSSGKWEKRVGNNLAGKTVGVIGTGRIGQRVCEILQSLGAAIIAYDIVPNEEWGEINMIEYVAFDELLARADILTLHAAATVGNLLGEIEFTKMKQGVIIINTARGSLINEAALCLAIEKGWVSGAGLDVFSVEPYKGELTRFDNVVLTPHIATLTVESRRQMEIDAVKNLLDCLEKS